MFIFPCLRLSHLYLYICIYIYSFFTFLSVFVCSLAFSIFFWVIWLDKKKRKIWLVQSRCATPNVMYGHTKVINTFINLFRFLHGTTPMILRPRSHLARSFHCGVLLPQPLLRNNWHDSFQSKSQHMKLKRIRTIMYTSKLVNA